MDLGAKFLYPFQLIYVIDSMDLNVYLVNDVLNLNEILIFFTRPFVFWSVVFPISLECLVLSPVHDFSRFDLHLFESRLKTFNSV